MKKSIREIEVRESCYGHGISKKPVLPGTVIERMVAVRSPECIPFSVIRKVGLMDETLAPFTYDNHDYSIRCLKHGLRNYMTPIAYISEIEWGGMRKRPNEYVHNIMDRNRKYIFEKHSDFVRELLNTHSFNKKYKIDSFKSEHESKLIKEYKNRAFSVSLMGRVVRKITGKP